MYKVTVCKAVKDEMAPMLVITERATFYFDVDSAALMFCDMAPTHGFSVSEYVHIQTTSVNGAVTSIMQKFNIDLTK